jgi:hypothetical protein
MEQAVMAVIELTPIPARLEQQIEEMVVEALAGIQP